MNCLVKKIERESDMEYSFNVDTKIEKACDKGGGSRYVLCNPRLLINNEHSGVGTLVASNGKVLAAVPVDVTTGDPRDGVRDLEVPVKAIPTRKGKGRRVQKGEAGWTNSQTDTIHPPVPESRYPKVDEALPEWGGKDWRVEVTLNAELLYNLALAITGANDPKRVTLRIGQPNTPIAVAGDLGIGVIMPCEGADRGEQYKQTASQLAAYYAEGEE